MKTISNNRITVTELSKMSERMFGNLVKAVVDIEKEIMVVDAELHSDEEAILVSSGSLRKNLWGINLHPDHFGTTNFIEYDSMINLKPPHINNSRNIDDPRIQTQIRKIVERLVINE